MILGIDLGTKNSLIGFYDGETRLIKNEFDSYMTPSVVHITNKGEVLVGKLAQQKLSSHPEQTFEMFKREMGTEKIYKVKKKKYTPTHLSSFILRYLVSQFKAEYPDEEIEGVVISVPAYFNENQRYETKRAGQLAGLNVIQMLNEPSAAALHSNQGASNFDKTIILDLGGGTFDVTVVECFENVYEILSIAGDVNLGGQDYTQALISLCCRKYNLIESEELAELCEKAKMELTHDMAETSFQYNGKTIEISFDDFYQTVNFINNKVHPILLKAIQDAKINNINTLENIIFIGGGSKLYAFRKYIYEFLSTNEDNSTFVLEDDCDFAVAYGVVLYTGILQNHDGASDIILTDVCPFTLGSKMYNSASKKAYFTPIIHRNTTLPATHSISGTPQRKNQKEVIIHILQGESFDPEKNLDLGSVTIACNGSGDEILITFTYDINSILKVTVKNLTLNIEEEVFIHHDQNLSDKERKQLAQELQSLDYIKQQRQRQEYYLNRLNGFFECASGNQKIYFSDLLHNYTALIESGTHKEQRQMELELDKLNVDSVNIALSDDSGNEDDPLIN